VHNAFGYVELGILMIISNHKQLRLLGNRLFCCRL